MVRIGLTACVAWAAAIWSPAVVAAGDCPQLPPDSGLRWEQRDVPGMVFCKAIGTDGERFSVTLGNSLPFRPVGSQQSGRGTLDGRKIRWYRGSDGFDPGILLRETLVKLGAGREAHIVIRASSEDALAVRLQQVETLRFDPGD